MGTGTKPDSSPPPAGYPGDAGVEMSRGSAAGYPQPSQASYGYPGAPPAYPQPAPQAYPQPSPPSYPQAMPSPPSYSQGVPPPYPQAPVGGVPVMMPAQPIPGITVKAPRVPPQAGQIIVGYEVGQYEAGCCQCEGLSQAGLLSVIILILLFWPLAWIPCVMPECFEKYQRPIYGYPQQAPPQAYPTGIPTGAPVNPPAYPPPPQH